MLDPDEDSGELSRYFSILSLVPLAVKNSSAKFDDNSDSKYLDPN